LLAFKPGTSTYCAIVPLQLLQSSLLSLIWDELTYSALSLILFASQEIRQETLNNNRINRPEKVLTNDIASSGVFCFSGCYLLVEMGALK